MLTIAAALAEHIAVGDEAAQRELEEIARRKSEVSAALTEARERRGQVAWIEVLAARLEQASIEDDGWADELRDAWTRLVLGPQTSAGGNSIVGTIVGGRVIQVGDITGTLQF